MELENASGEDLRISDLSKATVKVRTRHKDGDQHSKYILLNQAIVAQPDGGYKWPLRFAMRMSALARKLSSRVNGTTKTVRELHR
jgi:hypothetical protein